MEPAGGFGPIAVTFNISTVTALTLDGPTVAKIFDGAITTWNDPAIQALNTGFTLPGEPIHVVFRNDESGTTDNFQKYIDAASNGAWGKGAGKTLKVVSVRAPRATTVRRRRSRQQKGPSPITNGRNLKRAGPRSIAMHLRYIERDGVTADGTPAHAYGAELDAVDTQEFGSRCQGDRHQFRFIVSPEDGVEIADLKAFTRELLVHMEGDLGTKLEWVAVDHWDTDNPHTHVVLRGKDSGNRDLIIDRDYITQGMRARAAEVAESWLGLRTQQEIEESLNREIEQERWTRIDRAIQAKLIEGVIDLRRREGNLESQVERNHMVGRLQHLESMGLAEESSTSVWRVSPQAEPVLRTMGERGDIIRTMQRAFSNERRDFDIVRPEGPRTPIVGRITAKGLAANP